MGKGKKNLGGAECTKRRVAILERYAKLGTTLSPEQRNDFIWFKTEWDAQGRERHGDAWPDKFLSMLKGVLDELPQDPSAFSKFMLDEERNVFGGTRALFVPGKYTDIMG